MLKISIKFRKYFKARLGSFLKMLKLGSARLADQKARLGSARQKVGSGATLDANQFRSTCVSVASPVAYAAAYATAY